jgi:bla regulator protein blaR1
LMGYKVSMESLAVHLGLLLHVPLTDNTGLKGEFDLKLEWGPDQYALTAPEAVAPEELEKLPLQNALEEQLGLKLQVHSVPLPVLVVDHAERPSAN